VHLLVPPALRPGRTRERVASFLYAGVIVEPGAANDRVIDAVAAAAGATGRVERFRASTAGGLVAEVSLVSGERAILRAAGIGWPGDPASAADALVALADSGVPAPRLISRGSTAGASWTLETFVPGARPRALDPALTAALSTVAARLPRADGRPSAVLRDLDRIGSALPRYAAPLRSLHDRFRGVQAPAILRHGDLWLGNVLAGDGGLFIVDWEGWAADGLPGTDLLHLYATERRIDRRADMGEVWLARAWHDAAFRRIADPYWTSIGWRPGAADEDLVGYAWWAAEIAGTLSRVPERAADARWTSINVEAVLARASS